MEIRKKQERVETLRRLAARRPAQLSEVRVQTSPDPALAQAILADAADEEREIEKLEEERLRAFREAALAISRVRDTRQARLLELRYLEGFGWPVVIARMHHCESWVFRLHALALAAVPVPPDPPEEP